MKKKWLKWLVLIVFVLIVAVVAVLLLGKGYRVIKVEDFDGEVILERDSDEKDLFEGMKLKSEDTLTTEEDGIIELLVDTDKHILARENTCFTIQSSGNKKKGKLTIELEYGASLIEIENKLPDGYEVGVETPNASLSVRGTTFEVAYNKDTKTTVVEVIEGKVKVESDKESVNVEAGKGAIIKDDDIVLKDLFLYEDTPVFELQSIIGDRSSAIYVKQLTDWQYVQGIYKGTVTEDGMVSTDAVINEFKKDGVSIRYCISTADEMYTEIDAQAENRDLYGLWKTVNDDGASVLVEEYDYQGRNGSIERAFRYYKEITEDMYLDIYVYDQDGGESLGDATKETYLDLTKNCYYTYGMAVPVEPSDNSGSISGGGSEMTEPVDNNTSPFGKTYLTNSDFPDLIKGGSSYNQMKYMIKIALVADMNGHTDYLKEALYLMCFEGYQTDVFPPVEGTENVYDIDMLNNMFSFLTDEVIEEKHLNTGSTISGNQLTTYRDWNVPHELTAIGLASMYYGENEEIVIEFIAEKHTIVDENSVEILQYKGTAYLKKDEIGKYVFDYLEWEER